MSNPQRCLAVLALFTFVTDARAADPPKGPIDLRISRALLNTIAGKAIDENPSPARIREFDEAAPDTVGRSWGHSDSAYTIRRKGERPVVVNLHFSITVEKAGYRPDPAAEKRWQAASKGRKDTATGAEVAGLMQKVGKVNRSIVIYRQRKDGYRLMMRAIRQDDDETVDEAVARVAPLYGNFKKQFNHEVTGDVGLNLLVVNVVEGGEPEGPLEDGDVVQVPYENTQPHDVRLTTAAVSDQLDPDKPYTVEFQLDEKRGKATLLDAGGRALRDTDGDGWVELVCRGDTDKPTGFRVRLAKYTDKPLILDQFAVVRARVELEEPLEFSFGIQRRFWYPIVQRFELIVRGDRAAGGGGDTEVSREFGESELDGRIPFNRYMRSGATLFEAYAQRYGEYFRTRGEIAAGEAVCLSWQRDPRQAKSTAFLVASNESATSTDPIPFVPLNRPVYPIIDVKLITAPKVLSLNGAGATEQYDPVTGLPVGDGGGGGGGETTEVEDGLQVEVELRRRVSVDEYELSLHRIVESPVGESLDEARRRLPTRLRAEPDRDKSVYRVGRTPGKQRVGDYFPLTHRYVDPEANPGSRIPIVTFTQPKGEQTIRVAGTYELRLQSKFVGPGRLEIPLDVAIRFGAAKTDKFSARLLELELQRARERPRPRR